MQSYTALPEDELKTKIKDEEQKIEDAETNFKTAVDNLQAQFENLVKVRDDAIQAVKDGGLGLMKRVSGCAASDKAPNEL